MKLCTSLLLLSSTGAFTVPSRLPVPPKAQTTTALAIAVDPLVLAAAGLAVVGGVGAAVISGKIRELDETTTTAVAAAESAAPAEPVPEEQPAARETEPPTPEAEPPTPEAEPAVDVSIPYDAAARLAYEEAGSEGDFEEFKAKYEADAVADVIAKNKAE